MKEKIHLTYNDVITSGDTSISRTANLLKVKIDSFKPITLHIESNKQKLSSENNESGAPSKAGLYKYELPSEWKDKIISRHEAPLKLALMGLHDTRIDEFSRPR